jgi:hypothetical protein
MTTDQDGIDRTESSASPPTVTHVNQPKSGSSRVPDRIGPFKILAKIGEGD